MTEYEKKQLNEIKLWKEQKPSVINQSVGTVVKPFVCLVNEIIPQKMIQKALTEFNIFAQALTDENDIIRDGNVNEISELKTKDLRISDKLSKDVQNWAIAALGTEGGVTGILGIPGMVVDIPMVITLALRTIYKIGLCYGYKTKTDEDVHFVYLILSVAGANTIQERNIFIDYLNQLNIVLAKQALKKMMGKAVERKFSQNAVLITVRNLAKQLGINLTKRKLLQTIPIFGAFVGATINISFINDISCAARRCFQERWLIENEKI